MSRWLVDVFATVSLWLLVSLITAVMIGCGGAGGESQKPDPVVVDHPIAYVKRPLLGDVQEDVRTASLFRPGADLFFREVASPSGAEKNLTAAITGGTGDVRDVDVSFDGSKLLFALHLPEIEGAAEDEQPTWNIWEYEIASQTLRRIISSDITAEVGQDIAPHYLPDGRIVFSSTRQRGSKATLLDEGKPQYSALNEAMNEPAFVLHVMNADGSDIHQISFNRSHDLDPTVRNTGEIVFSRWNNAGGNNAISLYQIHPDGSELELLYGANSHNTGSNGANVQFLGTRPFPDGTLMAVLKPFVGLDGGGDLVQIDVENYVDNAQPVWSSRNILTAPGQTPATAQQVLTHDVPSPGGRFHDAFPLWDGTDRLLVSWTQCRLLIDDLILPCTTELLADPNAQEAPPLYGIFIYDRTERTQLPVVAPEEGVVFADVVAAQPRMLPTVLLEKLPGVELDPQLVDEGVGVLHIRSVYDMDGADTATPSIAGLADPAQTAADQRPARFLRVAKAVSLPDDDVLDIPNTAFGRTRQWGMREILAYTAIEPDGSVKVKVPANVPLTFSILDRNGRRISARHDSWLQVRPGEVVECNGCHDPASDIPHGRRDAVPPSVNAGAAADGLPFPNTEAALWANVGETMAETRMRISCQTDCAAMTPSVDLVYQDVWTALSVRPKDTPFSYLYADLTTLAPTTAACQSAWTPLCRTIINYERHIHPLWNQPRQLLDGGGNLIEDRTCTLCHSPTDAQSAVQVPAGQLDLTDGPSGDEPDHYKSYRELLFTDAEQEIVGGVLQDRLVQATDGAGNPLFETDAQGNLILDGNGQPIPIMVPVPAPGPSMRAGSALGGYFLQKFDTGGSHAGYLSDAEMKLLAEWLDIGAQYWNNPFDIPVGN